MSATETSLMRRTRGRRHRRSASAPPSDGLRSPWAGTRGLLWAGVGSALRWLAALFAAGAAVLAQAADPPPGERAHWYCWYAAPSTVSCLLETAPETLDPDGVDAASLQRLPPVVTDMRVQPGRLRRQQIDTPLHTMPTDMTFVALLSRSVMCGSQSRCAVAFSETPDRARIAAILDAHAKVALR